MRSLGLLTILIFIIVLNITSVVDSLRSSKKTSSSQNLELSCSKSSEAEVDVVFGRMSGYGNVSRPYPSTENELQEYCNGQFADIKMIESYAKRCQKGLPKQYFSLMLYTIKGNMQRICKKNSKKAKTFLSVAPCMRRASLPFDSCHRKLIERLHRIKHTTDQKKKIPYVCCEYYTLRKCFHDKGTKEAKCSEKEMETVEELMESTSSNSMNFFCGEYADDGDKCEKLGPLASAKGHKKPKFVRSISLTVAEIFDSFPEQSVNA